ncbi:Class B secretin-like G-protein coupled receptor GPRmth6, putative [Gryllus bimaculatus]|nr:Class B secretin-like G-protein coupled receptor GPRmth6, putative [Gryllus bimaculatus]
MWTKLSASSSALMASTSQFSPWSLTSSSRSTFLRWHARCFAVLLLLSASVNGGMHINKCCGANEQLDAWLKKCVPYEGAVTAALKEKAATDSSLTAQNALTAENASSAEMSSATELPTTTVLMTTTEEPTTTPPDEVMFRDGLPYWIDPNLTVLETHSQLPLVAGAKWAGARVTFGHRPCPYSQTQFVNTVRHESYQLLANGSLLLPMWRTDGDGSGRWPVKVALPPDEWCMDRVKSGIFVFLACPCQRVTCLNRCCNKNSMYAAERNRTKLKSICKKVENANATVKDPVFFSGTQRLNDTADAGRSDDTGVGGGGGVVYTELFAHSLECEVAIYGMYLLNSHSEDKKFSFWIQRNGSVLIENYNHGRAFQRQHVCHVEVETSHGGVISDVFFCHKRTTAAPDTENFYYSLLFLLGSLFLLLTLVVHALVPELRRSAHAKALMCHCASLLVASLTLTAGHLHRSALQPYCSISAYLVQFFFLSTFFWLNVMCFDLSWTFGAMRRRRVAGGGGDRSRRFLWYSLYAWGCPALITGVTLFMELAPEHVVPPDLPLLPNIGARRCWFDNGDGGGDSTVASSEGADHEKVSQTAAKTASAKSPKKSAIKSGDRQMLIVFAKLFCLMGVTWVTEIVSWLAGDDSFAFWYITDAVNLLRGVLIFVFFCCKPVALRPLRARLRACARRCCPVALRLGASRKQTRVSVSTLESSLSMPDMVDSAATAVVPAAPGAASAIGVKDDAL